MKINTLNEHKIIVCSFTPFHMYGLASHLNKIGRLKFLITNYPKYKIREYKIDKNKLITFIVTGILLNILRKLPIYQTTFFRGAFVKFLCFYFCKSVKNFIQNLKDEKLIFWGMSGYCFEPISEVNKKGGVSIVDFGSLSLEFQQELNFFYFRNTDYKPKKINKWMIERQKKEFIRANIVVVTSEFSKESFKKIGLDASKIIVKHPTPDLNYFRLNKKISKNSTFTFLFVGGLSLNKGIEFLCEAFSSEFSLEEATLKIVGGKVDKKYFNYLIKKFNHSNILFLGTKNKKKLADYYNEADCTVLPSIADGFGKTVLESLSCGTPAICSNNVGAKDILPGQLSDLSWDPSDIISIKKSLRYMFKNRLSNIKTRDFLADKYKYENYIKRLKGEDEQVFLKIEQYMNNGF